MNKLPENIGNEYHISKTNAIEKAAKLKPILEKMMKIEFYVNMKYTAIYLNPERYDEIKKLHKGSLDLKTDIRNYVKSMFIEKFGIKSM